jgi:hypothetical protein
MSTKPDRQWIRPRTAVATSISTVVFTVLLVSGLPGHKLASQGTSTLVEISQHGGSAGAVLVHDGVPYIAVGPRVLRLDPGAAVGGGGALQPTAIGESLPGLVQAVAVDSAGRILITGDRFGLAVYSAVPSSTQRFSAMAAIGFDGVAVTTIENRVIVVDSVGVLRVFDLAALPSPGGVSVEALPEVTRRQLLPPGAATVAGPATRTGAMWWVTLGSAASSAPAAWMIGIDLRDAVPSTVARVALVALPAAIAARGDTLLVEENGVIRTWDVSDPSAPSAAQAPIQGLSGLPTAIGSAVGAPSLWIVGHAPVSPADLDAPAGIAWTIDMSEPSVPVVTGTVALTSRADGVAVGDDGDAWVVHADTALTFVTTDDTEVQDPLSPLWRDVGPVHDAVATGDLTAVAAGTSGLWLLQTEVSPGEAVVRHIALPGSVDAVAFDGERGLLWATTQRPGALYAIDMGAATAGDPDPVIARVTETIDTPLALAVEGTRVYVADYETGVVIIDATDPHLPVTGGRETRVPRAWDVLPDGDRLWVAEGDRAVSWLEVLDPEEPRLLGRVGTPGTAIGLARFGALVLVADHGGGLQVVGTQENQPLVIGRYGESLVLDVDTSGGFAFLGLGEEGLLELEPGDGRSPRQRGTLPLAGLVRRVSAAPEGDGARVLAAAYEGGLHVLRAEPPAAPPSATPRPTPTATATPFAPSFIPWAGTGREGPPNTLVERGVISPEVLDGRGVTRVAMRGAQIVVGLESDAGDARQGVAMLEVDEQGALRLASRWDGLEGGLRDLAFDGKRVYVASWSPALEILAVDAAGSFTRLSSLTSSLRASRVALGIDETVHLAGTRLDTGPRAGLEAVDVSDPMAPRSRGRARLGDASAIAQNGDALYVADYAAGGVHIYDVSNPDVLTASGMIAVKNVADIAAMNGILALAIRTDGAEYAGGIVLYDASRPLAPTAMGKWERSGDEFGARPAHLVLSQGRTGPMAWLAGESNIVVLDLSEPQLPRVVAMTPIGAAGIVDMAAEGDRVVWAHRAKGIVLAEIVEH